MKKILLLAIAASLAQGCLTFHRVTTKKDGTSATTHITTQHEVHLDLVPNKKEPLQRAR